MLDHEDWARWPSEYVRIEARYSDITSDILLRVPALQAFAAMKTLARADRHAARDLYDLARLAELGALTAGLDRESQLAHQTSDLPSPERCLRTVREAYGTVLGR